MRNCSPPTRIYAKDVLDIAALLGGDLHAVSHITGGGLAANVARVLPLGQTAVIERGSWAPQPIFDLIGDLGGVPRADREATFNLGVGMVLVITRSAADRTIRRLTERGLNSWVLGQVRPTDPDVDLTGSVQGSKGVNGGTVRLVGEQARR